MTQWQRLDRDLRNSWELGRVSLGLLLTQKLSGGVSVEEADEFLSRMGHCRCEFPLWHLWG